MRGRKAYICLVEHNNNTMVKMAGVVRTVLDLHAIEFGEHCKYEHACKVMMTMTQSTMSVVDSDNSKHICNLRVQVIVLVLQ